MQCEMTTTAGERCQFAARWKVILRAPIPAGTAAVSANLCNVHRRRANLFRRVLRDRPLRADEQAPPAADPGPVVVVEAPAAAPGRPQEARGGAEGRRPAPTSETARSAVLVGAGAFLLALTVGASLEQAGDAFDRAARAFLGARQAGEKAPPDPLVTTRNNVTPPRS